MRRRCWRVPRPGRDRTAALARTPPGRRGRGQRNNKNQAPGESGAGPRQEGLRGFASFISTLQDHITAGAFILNSGVSKLSADEPTAARLHGVAAGTYPFLNAVKPKDFARLLSIGEIALGSALLLPVVPAARPGWP